MFVPICQFDLMKGFEGMLVVDDTKFYDFAVALNRLRWLHSDRMEKDFSREGESDWFCRHYKEIFERLGIKDQPAFFSRN